MRATKETKHEQTLHLEPELSEKERSERENRSVGTEETGKREKQEQKLKFKRLDKGQRYWWGEGKNGVTERQV